MSTNNSPHFKAAERLVEFYTWVESMLDLTAPPPNPLTDSQMVTYYSDIVANPLMQKIVEQIMGPQQWAAFSQRMKEKASLLGMSEIGLANEVEPEDRTQMMLTTVEGLAQMEKTNGTTGTGLR